MQTFLRAAARDEQLRAETVAAESEPPVQMAPPARWSSTIVQWAMAASFLGLIAWFASAPPKTASAMTLVRSSGTVSLESDQGQASPLQVGEAINSGTLSVQGDGARAEFTYPDGSTLLFAGDSEFTLGQRADKTLHLNRGALRANVTPESIRRPLVLRTPTAEATAVGTEFALNATAAETLVQVDRGSVQLRRLCDDQIVTVSGNEQVRAGNTVAQQFVSKPAQPAPSRWKADSGDDSIHWKGQWSKDGTLVAAAETIYRKDVQREEVHFHAGAKNEFPGLATLDSDSAVRIKFRLKYAINVGVFISTRSSGWDFTGNFQAYIDHSRAPVDADGWRTVTIPMSQFNPLHRGGQRFQDGRVAATVFATTYSIDAGLEIAELEVIAGKDET